jgi:hypothetical protein
MSRLTETGLLHLVGSWYIWLSFAVGIGKRVPLGPIYWAMFALVVLAAVLRIVAMQSRGRQVALGLVLTAIAVFGFASGAGHSS